MTRSVVAIFAHPDDEVLGCAGTIANHADEGNSVDILILAVGLQSRGGAGRAEIESLRTDARRSADVLGATGIEFGDFPDNAMDSVPILDVVQTIEDFLGRHRAAIIYTHHGGDLNVDHRIVHQAVVTACRPLPGYSGHTVLACEVNSSTEWTSPIAAPFVPTEFEDINRSLERKVAALECYSSEIRSWPHPRSVEGVRALARWRGAQCGMDAAEAFMTVRRVRSACAT
jgi:LmbE family N-acetylglucosaminyl deacetylase